MPEFFREGATLHYETWGDPESPPVVLLHGFTADHRMWLPQVEALSRDYYVVAPDLRGHGRSADSGDPGGWTIATYAEDLRGLLDTLGADRCAPVGCSFGGMVALQFAVTWPERVAALIVSDSSPAVEHGAYTDAFRERERRIAGSAEVVHRQGVAALGKRAAAPVADAFLADGVRSRYARLSSDGFLGAEEARRSRPDVTPLLRDRLTMPVLLCWGEDDPVIAALDVMAAELPGARILSFRECGHGVPAHRPDAFNRAALAFLEDVEEGRAIAGRQSL